MDAAFDATGAVVARVREAVQLRRGLTIVGGGTHSVWHLPARAAALEIDMKRHAGILSHEPSELVVTARAGTPLAELEAALAEHGQVLPFDPPRFGAEATLGGAVASGLSGPARPWYGAVRDAVLGVRIVDGRGEVCRFGGEVMKNVAGYDLSRLQAGAFGTLGVILDVSLRVRAAPEVTRTQVLELGLSAALDRMLAFGRRPWPVTGLAWADGELRVRLAGAAEGVSAAAREVGGTEASEDRFFERLRDLELDELAATEGSLWRLSVPFDAPHADFPANWVIDWGGAQRWCVTDTEPGRVFAAARGLGGHARRLRPSLLGTAPAPGVAALEARVRAALDPAGVLNPGVMDLEEG
ncbi:MAG: glycolate oxidase subunit GlcE [Pseudomonadales bacterium]|jgi:glycolate oxidase FAD binding subunit|nr:glycolate oxidase subunit GlcE [Pseudomonadales bacterium]